MQARMVVRTRAWVVDEMNTHACYGKILTSRLFETAFEAKADVSQIIR